MKNLSLNNNEGESSDDAGTPSFISLSQKGVFSITAITFFRELLEVILFILTSSNGSPYLVAGASLVGLVCAALIVYIVSKGIANFNIGILVYAVPSYFIMIKSDLKKYMNSNKIK